jgi:hypothetical protein
MYGKRWDEEAPSKLKRLMEPAVKAKLEKKGWQVSTEGTEGHENLHLSIPVALALKQAQTSKPRNGGLKPIGVALDDMVEPGWYRDLPKYVRKKLLADLAGKNRKERLKSRAQDPGALRGKASIHNGDSKPGSDRDVSHTKDIPKRDHKFILRSS